MSKEDEAKAAGGGASRASVKLQPPTPKKKSGWSAQSMIDQANQRASMKGATRESVNQPEGDPEVKEEEEKSEDDEDPFAGLESK
jgi:hypothetical protein